MAKFIRGFIRGLFIGIIFLPLEFWLLISTPHPVFAQEDLRGQIRSQVADPREIRSEIIDPRDSVVKPCEQDPREGCARPIPRPSPSPEPQVSPTPLPSSVPGPSQTPGPSETPSSSSEPASSPSPSSSPAVGGGGPSASSQPSSGGENVSSQTSPAVLGLSFTGSGRW